MNPLTWAAFALLTRIVVISAGQAGRTNRLDIVVKEVIVASGEMPSVRVTGTSVPVAVVREHSRVEVKKKTMVSSYGRFRTILLVALPT